MLRLGKTEATRDERDLKLSAVLGVQLPAARVLPYRFGHATLFQDWAMLGNGPDPTVAPGFAGAGDCVFAGAAHETMVTAHLGGHHVTFTGREVIADYSAVTGYRVDDPATDNGTNVREALKYRAKVGIGDVAGQRHKIGAYVALHPGDWDQLLVACYVFGAVGTGVRFPASAMDQFEAGEPWDVVPDSPIDGGHYVPVFGRTGKHTAAVVTWGQRIGMTREFYETYGDEAWAIVYPEELRRGKSERGFDLATLNQLLAALH